MSTGTSAVQGAEVPVAKLETRAIVKSYVVTTVIPSAAKISSVPVGSIVP
jgi:hypothetical protein